VSVVIVTYNSTAHIGDCLSSLYESSAPWIAEFIVVDNASPDGTADYVRKHFPQMTLIANDKNVGFGSAVNLGAKDAHSEYLLIVNPDTVSRTGSVEELVLFLDNRPKAATCGPMIVDRDGVFQHSCRRGFPTPLNSLGYLTGLDRLLPWSRSLGGYYRRDVGIDLEMETDSLAGCYMLVRRDQFEHVGGFDEDYFLFGEDIDLCWKFKHSGSEVWYIPSACVEHWKGASTKQAPKTAHREFYRSMKLFMDKRLRGQYPRFVLGAAKIGVDVIALLERRFQS
jgi:GT2 family glycosyltransferase